MTFSQTTQVSHSIALLLYKIVIVSCFLCSSYCRGGKKTHFSAQSCSDIS